MLVENSLISIIFFFFGLAVGGHSLIEDAEFSNALYMIDIGQNDISDSFAKNMSYVQVVKSIPTITTEISNAIKVRIHI